MNKCNGLVGLLFGHKFETRYDEEVGEGKWPFQEGTIESQLTSTDTRYISEIVDSTRSHKETYIRDICKRCGTTVEKK